MTASERLAARVRALAQAVESADGRSDAALIGRAKEVVGRAGRRVAFSGSHTVVAFAGATGSGKSSLFNAVTGTQLARVAVRRPTTSKPLAVSWGTELPHELLDWLDVTARHLVPSEDASLADLVLLDLPDHDSTEVTHRLTVDRLVELVDALIWVVDPQKYADAALHDGYLKRLAPYADVMMVVLNQTDRLEPSDLDRCLRDLRRLLDAEGLRATPIMATSALRGTGVNELRAALARTAADKRAMTQRLATDVSVAAAAMAGELSGVKASELEPRLRQQVEKVLGEAAGVPVVTDGVRDAWRRRGSAATGWPFVSWISRLKPDPLRRLRLDLSPGDQRPAEVNRTSLPKATSVQRARVDQGLRELADAASAGLPPGWARAVREAPRGNQALLRDELDAAIAGTELGLARGTWWWGLFGLVQWLLIGAVLAGAVWLFANPLLVSLGLPRLPIVTWYSIPAGTWLLAGGVLGGVLLALVGRVLVEVGARSHARAAERDLAEAVNGVVGREVFAPVEAELARLSATIKALKLAQD